MKDATDLGAAPLTPAEKLEQLLDAFALYHLRELATDALFNKLTGAGISGAELYDLLVPKYDAQLDAQKEVIAHLKVLVSEGHLARCAQILQIETAGCP